jgi:hypothetical protein
VRVLLERGVRHADIRKAVRRLARYGDWPLSEASLATTADTPQPLIAVREPEGIFVLGARGWQEVVTPPPLEDVRLRLRRS